MSGKDQRVVFALGTGRCGTNFLYKVFKEEKTVASTHERHPLPDTFQRYAKWNNLPVDDAGFLAIKEEGIKADHLTHKVSFEASAYLSLSVRELHEKFNAKFILLIRDPHKVINSYIQKGWYANEIIRDDVNKVVNFQPNMKFPHHSFSRIIPNGNEGKKWSNYTIVGKLAWYWNALNQSCIDQLKELPEDQYQIVRLEDLNHETFKGLEDLFGTSFDTSELAYKNLVKSKPNKLNPQRTVASWSDQERKEYLAEVTGLATQFGYETDLEKVISKEEAKQQSVEKPSLLKKIFG